MQRSKRGHYEPIAVYEMVQRIKESGVDLRRVAGPWHPIGRRPSRPERIITNEHTQVVMDTGERAADVAGLLNWCGVDDLNPVPDLTPATTESQDLEQHED